MFAEGCMEGVGVDGEHANCKIDTGEQRFASHVLDF